MPEYPGTSPYITAVSTVRSPTAFFSQMDSIGGGRQCLTLLFSHCVSSPLFVGRCH